jgi:hypothetical protein
MLFFLLLELDLGAVLVVLVDLLVLEGLGSLRDLSVQLDDAKF